MLSYTKILKKLSPSPTISAKCIAVITAMLADVVDAQNSTDSASPDDITGGQKILIITGEVLVLLGLGYCLIRWFTGEPICQRNTSLQIHIAESPSNEQHELKAENKLPTPTPPAGTQNDINLLASPPTMSSTLSSPLSAESLSPQNIRSTRLTPRAAFD